MRTVITDDLWERMELVVGAAKWHKGGRPPDLPDRVFFEALLYLARTGVPWRDPPGDLGAWRAVDNRFRRWQMPGGLRTLPEGLAADPAFGDVRRALVGPTVVRARRHAAGARRRERGPARGGRSGSRRWAGAAAGRPPRW